MRHITSENARELQALGAAAKRQKREEAERVALEQLAEMLQPALGRLRALVEAESESVSLGAVEKVLERLLGRPAQAHELSGRDGGPVEIVVRSAFDDSGVGGAVPGDGEAESAS